MNAIKKDEPASQSTPTIDPRAGGSGESRVVAGVLVPDTPSVVDFLRVLPSASKRYETLPLSTGQPRAKRKP